MRFILRKILQAGLYGVVMVISLVGTDVHAEATIQAAPCQGDCSPNESLEFRAHPSCGFPGSPGKFKCWNFCNSTKHKCERKCEFQECSKV